MNLWCKGCGKQHVVDYNGSYTLTSNNSATCECGGFLITSDYLPEVVRALHELLTNDPLIHWTDERRMEVFGNYCVDCGSNDPKCCCMRDD